MSKGLTQAKLAARLGVSRASVQNWEAGRFVPSASMFPKLAKALGADAIDIVREFNVAEPSAA